MSKILEKQYKVEGDILFYAFRYALGRQTFAPTTVIDNINNNIELFSNDGLKLFIKEISQAEEDNSLGNEKIDKPTWLNFRDYLENVINNR